MSDKFVKALKLTKANTKQYQQQWRESSSYDDETITASKEHNGEKFGIDVVICR